jgi:hypothetical protein
MRAVILVSLLALAACTPPRPNLGRPLTAIEECQYDLDRKHAQCEECWFLLPIEIWPAFVCRLACTPGEDRIANQCRTFEFEAEQHPTRVNADVTIHDDH